jgi:CBS domain containing-hemolysin-like protein
MKSDAVFHRPHRRTAAVLAALVAAMLAPSQAHASIFQGEALDTLADVLAWVVLIVAPAVGIGVFWILHILPEKIAEKRQHPQTGAIQCLCLLSLVFGGLLWPIAWLWAFSKPVLYKMAYGTDKVAHGHGDESKGPADHGTPDKEHKQSGKPAAEPESKPAAKSAEGGKA